VATRKSPASTNSSGESTPDERNPPAALRTGSTASARPLKALCTWWRTLSITEETEEGSVLTVKENKIPAGHTRFPRFLHVCAMQAVRRAQRLGPSRFVSAARPLGGTGVPQEWGQPRTGGTGFLGTPDNYTQLLQKRPISPDLFGVEGAGCED